MSQICIGKVEEIAKEDASQYETEVKRIMEKYGYGIFPVDWYEPLTELFDCLFFSIGDIHWGDCEQLLLPDGWYLGDFTNKIPFKERMNLLHNIAMYFANKGFCFELFIGWSGDLYEDYTCYRIHLHKLIPLLSETVGRNDQFASVHLYIDPDPIR